MISRRARRVRREIKKDEETGFTGLARYFSPFPDETVKTLATAFGGPESSFWPGIRPGQKIIPILLILSYFSAQFLHIVRLSQNTGEYRG